MAIFAKDPARNYPPLYDAFRRSGIPIEFFPFPGGDGRVHRFAARYRFAKEFQSAQFDTYASSTAAGYSALCKLLFTYGAFEALRRVLGSSPDLRKFDVAPYPLAEWDAALRTVPTHANIFHFMHDHLERAALRRECERFLARDRYNLLLIATAVRNTFAHGHLTPNAYHAEADDTRRICNVLIDALFTIMDREFSSRVSETIEDLNGPPN